MEWRFLCARASSARREGNGEMGDNAESYCSELLWPSSHSHPICHHNLFIRHSAGTFSEMWLLIIHVNLKWNWESGDQKGWGILKTCPSLCSLQSPHTFWGNTDYRRRSAEVFYLVMVRRAILNCITCHGDQRRADSAVCSQLQRGKWESFH